MPRALSRLSLLCADLSGHKNHVITADEAKIEKKNLKNMRHKILRVICTAAKSLIILIYQKLFRYFCFLFLFFFSGLIRPL